MKIEIERNESSLPIIYEAINAYTKGNMYCILFINSNKERIVHKFPMCSLFRVIEDYPDSKR